MDLVLCHTTADFDTLGAAVGVARLYPGTRIVLSGSTHPTVREFLGLFRDEYPLIERRSVDPTSLRRITVVDTQLQTQLGKAAEWLRLPEVEITVYDHHTDTISDIPAQQFWVESVGSATTLVTEQLQAQQVHLSVAEATVMALGIHADTGSLTYDNTTVRDSAALTWLLRQGASQRAIATYMEPGLSPKLQELLGQGLAQLQTASLWGYTLGWALLQTPEYSPGLAHLASHLLYLTGIDSLLLGNLYQTRGESDRLAIIGRSRLDSVDLHQLLLPLGGGGHARAAAVTLQTDAPADLLRDLFQQLQEQIAPPPLARQIMSSPVRTIRPETTIEQAHRILLRYGHSGLSVVDAGDQLIGMISRRDLDIALHHGFGHAPVKGYMSAPVKTITPETPLTQIQELMVDFDMGRLPVLEHEQLVGIVTRTDVLRQLHQLQRAAQRWEAHPIRTPIQQRLQSWVSPLHQQLLKAAAQQAAARGWQLYLVGGAVRDLLLASETQPFQAREFDLVVDGVVNPPESGAGVALARALQQTYPETQLQVHGQFQTAALVWPASTELGTFFVDIATARTEFYPYPAAHPEVTASSIRQDLYRRDFSVNALAVRLTQIDGQDAGELLDFFGGLADLQAHQIRVLHANSFIEDPTRIFRAVRFAVRLGFTIHPQTENYIRHAMDSGIYERIQLTHERAPSLESRLKNELKYIFQAAHWSQALKLLANLEALQCIHPDLVHLSSAQWRQIRTGDRWWQLLDPQSMVLHPWECRLELLLLSLPDVARATVAHTLSLTQTAQERLAQLDQVQTDLASHLTQDLPISQRVILLDRYDLATLVFVAVRAAIPVRCTIWHYLTRWSQVKAPLDGHDLKQMGFRPGPQYKDILAWLRALTLDSKIHTKAEAVARVQEQFLHSGID